MDLEPSSPAPLLDSDGDLLETDDGKVMRARTPVDHRVFASPSVGALNRRSKRQLSDLAWITKGMGLADGDDEDEVL